MNIFNMAKDLKGMEKMMKPALEKFMKDSGFVKKDVLDKLEKNNYDMILMDIQMPVMSGIEATQLIRKNYDKKSH